MVYHNSRGSNPMLYYALRIQGFVGLQPREKVKTKTQHIGCKHTVQKELKTNTETKKKSLPWDTGQTTGKRN